jgi:hypothetical protein
MIGDLIGADILIRPNGQVELLDRPEPPARTGSYAELMRPCAFGVRASARSRRQRSRLPDSLVRGRLVDIRE